MRQIPLKSSSSPSARSCGHLAVGEGTALRWLTEEGYSASCRLGLLNKPIYVCDGRAHAYHRGAHHSIEWFASIQRLTAQIKSDTHNDQNSLSDICKLRGRDDGHWPVEFLDAWIYISDEKYVCTLGWDIFQLSPSFLFTYRIAAHARGISMSWRHVPKCPRRLFCLDHTRTGLLIRNWERANV